MLRFTKNPLSRVMLIVGISIMLYPAISNWLNQCNQSRAASMYKNEVAALNSLRRLETLNLAREYNTLSAKNPQGRDYGEYESMLASANGVMAILSAPTINLNIPIYHGVSENILQNAAGHLPSSSLPVGGSFTHCVLTSHRGNPRATLFTNIDNLKNGDALVITVFGEELYYEVDQRKIVKPEEVNLHARIEVGQDLVTLITCTPYGINSHRELVRAHRITNAPYTQDQAKSASIQRLFGGLVVLIALITVAYQVFRNKLLPIRWGNPI